MLKKLFWHLRKPQGILGSFWLSSMNIGHTGISLWGLRHLEIKPGDWILDIGCGGGKNIARMMKRTAALSCAGMVCGLDHSAVSVQKSIRMNRHAVASGKVQLREGSVSQIPWPDRTFDMVTAFETVYFWPNLVQDLREVRRVLKKGGKVFVCNEMFRPEGKEAPYLFFVKTLEMTICSEKELKQALTDAGFQQITAILPEKGPRICVSGVKEN
jgi:ubiquinone/menaquinone biosynthesis C-methylase UbiE